MLVVVSPFSSKNFNKTKLFNFRRGYQYKSEALGYFNKGAKCYVGKCGYFSYEKLNIFSVIPDGLVNTDLLTEVKTKVCHGQLEDLRKNLSSFILKQLQMVCTGTKYCTI